MEPNYFLIIPGLFFPFMLLISLLRSLWRFGFNLLAILKVTPLTIESEVGEHIRFSGEVVHPHTESECFRLKSCLWRFMINAEFTSKAKKPGRGLVKHKPKIYEANNDHDLLTITDGNWIVHPLFPEQSKYILGAKIYKKRMGVLPREDLKQLAKPKYKTYLLTQFYIPARARVVVFGKVIAKVGSSITITGDREQDKPVFIFYGTFPQLVRSLVTKLLALMVLSGLIIFAGLVYWFVIADDSNPVYLIAIGFTTIILYAIKKGMRL